MSKPAQKYPVYLRVYDISDGAAALWSPVLLWKKIDGIWHTGIHAYGYEYFYGGGIIKMYPKDVEECYSMKPKEVLHLGYTTVPQHQFERFLEEVSSEFCRATYDLLKWNCNNFSDSCSKFLLERSIPDRIVNLPEIVNKTLMGKVILKAMKAMRGTPPVGAENHNDRSDRIATVSKTRRVSVTVECPKTDTLQIPSVNQSRRHSCPNAANGRRPSMTPTEPTCRQSAMHNATYNNNAQRLQLAR